MNFIKSVSRLALFARELIALITVLSFIGLLYYAVIYHPASNKIRTLRTGLETLDSEVLRLQSFMKLSENEMTRFQDLSKTLSETETRLFLIREQMPASGEAPKILKELSSPGFGLELTSVQTSSLEDKGEYIVMPVTLQMRGRFASIGRYLEGLEKSQKLISIENISITKDSETGLSLKLELNAYLMKDGAA